MVRLPQERLSAEPPLIGFIFLGGAHHVLHSAPVAAELARAGRCRITAYVSSEAEQAMLVRVLRAYGDPPVAMHRLSLPGWAERLARTSPRWSALKLPRLFLARRALGRHHALVATERTSTMLRRWLSPPPLLIHIPHGAGDRAKGFEARLRHFDLVIVAGEKDRQRMIADGVVGADRIVVGGSAKLGAMARLARDARPIFAGGRPTILYNPHFDGRIGSWSRLGRAVIERLAGADEFNLIVAPHVRLFERATPAERRAVEALSVPGRVHVDTGSPAASDMTYTAQADIYLGDVSSQVYEFAAHPRPCVFLNAHGVAWQEDPNYLFWRMGEVVDRVDDLLPALRRAPARFEAEYRAVQRAMIEQAYGGDNADAPRRAAEIIEAFLGGATHLSQKRRIALRFPGPIFGSAPDEHRGSP